MLNPLTRSTLDTTKISFLQEAYSVILTSEGNMVMDDRKGKRNYNVGAPYTGYFAFIILFNPPKNLPRKCHGPQLTGEKTEVSEG